MRDEIVKAIGMGGTMRYYLADSLNFITGVFRMSFSYILGANWRHGFYAVLALPRSSGL